MAKEKEKGKKHHIKIQNLKISLFPTTQQSNGLAQEYLTRKTKGEIEKDFDEIMKNPRFVDIEREKIWGMQGEVLKILRKERRRNWKKKKELFKAKLKRRDLKMDLKKVRLMFLNF